MEATEEVFYSAASTLKTGVISKTRRDGLGQKGNLFEARCCGNLVQQSSVSEEEDCIN